MFFIGYAIVLWISVKVDRMLRKYFFHAKYTIISLLLCGLLSACDSTSHEKDMSQGTENEQTGKTAEMIAPTDNEHIGRPDPKMQVPHVLESEGMDAEDVEDPAGLAVRKLGNVMVRIEAGSLGGSGVIVGCNENKLLIATAAHVLEQAQGTIKIRFIDNYEVLTSTYRCAENQDLAVMEVDLALLAEQSGGTEPVKDHSGEYAVAPWSTDAFDRAGIGDTVIAMGSKTGVGEDAYSGVILSDLIYSEDFKAYILLAQVMARPGMSGGGIFDTKGNLIGILCGISDEGEVAAVPVTGLKLLMAE